LGHPYEHMVRVIKVTKTKLTSKATNPLGEPYEHLVRIIKIN
jgi:hypothetical protein